MICIAGVQRELADRAVVDHRAQLRAGDVNERCFRGYFHRLRRGANLQGRIQCDRLVDIDGHILLYVPFETLLLELRRIVTGRNFYECVIAAPVGLGVAGDAGRLICDAYTHVGQDGAGRVSHPA